MQQRSTTQGRAERAAALCVVIGLHLLILILIWKTRESLLWPHDTSDHFIVWLRLNPSAVAVPTTVPETTETPAAQPRASQQPSSRNAPVATHVTESAPQPMNWNTQGAYFAKKTVEDSLNEPYRNFGPRKPGPPAEPEIPSVFEPEQDVKGEEAKDIHGDPVVRLNKYCYQELEKNVPTARDYGMDRKPQVKCFFDAGRREPRGDLFDHLKKKRPLPAPKDGASSELPERIEQQ